MSSLSLKIAFLVLTHDKPQQCARMLTAFQEMGTCFVHIDRDTPIDPFLKAMPPSDRVQYLQSRCSIRWASFDMVDATLRLLHQAIQSGTFDYFILLSGSDYPIKSKKHLFDFLAQGGEHIRGEVMPHPGHSLNRLDHYFVPAKNRNQLAIRMINLALRSLPPRRWRTGVLKGMTPSSGSSWWALSRDCVHYVLDYLEKNPAYLNFFRHSKYPDEMFFQIVINASPFASQVRWTPTFDIWDRPTPPYPATLHMEDLETLRTQPHLFARKFDLSADPEIFDVIDRELRNTV